MRAASILVLTVLLVGCGCATDPPAAPLPGSAVPTAATAPTATPPAPPPATSWTPPTPKTDAGTPPSTLLGTWKSASCGARTYERHIYFETDWTFQAEDLVSPCPPGVQCVWSGIVVRHGTYAVSGATVQLTPQAPSKAAGAPFPEALTLDASGAPGEPGCAYRR